METHGGFQPTNETGQGDCRLCEKQASRRPHELGFLYDCARCGKFIVTDELERTFHRNWDTYRLSGITRNASTRGQVIMLTSSNYEGLLESAPAPHDVETKGKSLLRHLAGRSRTPGKTTNFDRDLDHPLCYAADELEAHFLLTYLRDLGWIDWVNTGGSSQNCTVTPAGWIEAARAPRALSDMEGEASRGCRQQQNRIQRRLAMVSARGRIPVEPASRQGILELFDSSDHG